MSTDLIFEYENPAYTKRVKVTDIVEDGVHPDSCVTMSVQYINGDLHTLQIASKDFAAFTRQCQKVLAEVGDGL